MFFITNILEHEEFYLDDNSCFFLIELFSIVFCYLHNNLHHRLFLRIRYLFPVLMTHVIFFPIGIKENFRFLC